MVISHLLNRYLLSILTIFNCLFLSDILPKIALADTSINHKKCGDNLEDLANLLVNDIPDYANRVIQRNRIYSHPLEFFPLFIITAGKPDLDPLLLNQSQYKSLLKSNNYSNTYQIFFTTLEKQYSTNNRIIETQNFHWLILTKTPQDWKLVMALTKFGYPDNSPDQNFISSPPIDTTEGTIGQAIKLWLRDCSQNF
ncbi:hypothetical protein GM3708_978 [Geminocystis sp. NIES-3708]|uniref:hypothetical protein n=1 Tax=Geminocystis sp. NIES-3708 TaxID=1615909 RepID=UPI0005FC793F|nr:hypothetical protein [Geminocystis sp. NIES-3708]BAQ60572.1 hypothetical protein GM3708_978 [Geminocystis sp. NIES-3708]